MLSAFQEPVPQNSISDDALNQFAEQMSGELVTAVEAESRSAHWYRVQVGEDICTIERAQELKGLAVAHMGAR